MNTQYISSNKKSAQLVVEQCHNFGVENVIISPGSRNAPFIITFDNHPAFTCYSIPDERSAAFFALGMARQTNKPVALVCTSGTAVLNYAPAITEAYYQEIPLIAITADRPPELIDQEAGQTIRQQNIFANHIRHSVSLPVDDEHILNAKNDIQNAFYKALSLPKGPVHINVPFREPLYETEKIDIIHSPVNISNNINIEVSKLDKLIDTITVADKVMLIAGIHNPDREINNLVNLLATDKNFTVLAGATSNTGGEEIINIYDVVLKNITKQEVDKFKPQVLITTGKGVISKNLKQFLRNIPNLIHYDIDVNPAAVNTYGALTDTVHAYTDEALKYLYENIDKLDNSFKNNWLQKQQLVNKSFKELFLTDKLCDLAVFNEFFNNINEEIDLHLANSTPVRYAEFFAKNDLISYYCNRGTSGIDGSLSTAAGAAAASNKLTVLITGDIGFVYDSNAFWNRHIPDNLRVLLINNSGGNIFKIIPGPKTTNQLENFFETKQNTNNKLLCNAFNINYLSATTVNELHKQLNVFLDLNGRATVLEVFTDADFNVEIFEKLNKLID
jgi:2-succinyl-5-enolpyruvyl-6-hydroxy-3-cyclohexene-1-carboxylate synthase